MSILAEVLIPDTRADGVLSARPFPSGVASFLPAIKSRHAGRITGQLVLPERPGIYADFPENLDPRLAGALRARGIDRLYSHQLAAWNATGEDKHTVVVIPTASGKTLCYNLPMLQGVANHGAKALYLFPTKALAQDQVAELLELNAAGGLGLRAFNYPGGIGLSVPLYDLRDDVIVQARALVSAWCCRYGCPACVGPILETAEGNERSPKMAALRVLELLGMRED